VGRAPKGKGRGEFIGYFPFWRGRPWLGCACQAMGRLRRIQKQLSNPSVTLAGAPPERREGGLQAGALCLQASLSIVSSHAFGSVCCSWRQEGALAPPFSHVRAIWGKWVQV